MTTKQITNSISAPDGSQYVTITDGSGNLVGAGSAGIPAGATSVQASSGNVAAATATATLPATSGKTTYISGFQITGTGATAALAVNPTVTGLLGGTATYTYAAAAGVAVANTPLIVSFNPPLPASATNTTIVVSCPSLGTGNTNNTVVAQGFQI